MHKRNLRIFLYIICLGSYTAYGQATIGSNTHVTVATGTHTNFLQDVTVQNGGTLNANGLIAVGGDYTNNGAVNFGSASQLMFNGTIAQNINSTDSFAIPYMAINNSDASVTLNAPLTILDTLKMMHGALYTNATHPVHFANGSASPDESNQSYINGVAILDTIELGTGSLDKFLGCAIASGNNLGKVTITRNTGADAIITKGNISFIAANWYISSNAPSQHGFSLAREVDFSWVSPFDNGKQMSVMSLYNQDSKGRIILIDRNTQDVSATDPRNYVSKNVKVFNQTFTLTDTSTTPLSIAVTAQQGHQVSVYPNPFTNELTINIEKADTDPIQVYLTDISGKIILQQQMAAGTSAKLSVKPNSNLPVGIYLLHITNEHFSENFKLMKSN